MIRKRNRQRHLPDVKDTGHDPEGTAQPPPVSAGQSINGGSCACHVICILRKPEDQRGIHHMNRQLLPVLRSDPPDKRVKTLQVFLRFFMVSKIGGIQVCIQPAYLHRSGRKKHRFVPEEFLIADSHSGIPFIDPYMETKPHPKPFAQLPEFFKLPQAEDRKDGTVRIDPPLPKQVLHFPGIRLPQKKRASCAGGI